MTITNTDLIELLIAVRFSGDIYIKPGSLWENPFVESFKGRARDELLNIEEFATLTEARVIRSLASRPPSSSVDGPTNTNLHAHSGWINDLDRVTSGCAWSSMTSTWASKRPSRRSWSARLGSGAGCTSGAAELHRTDARCHLVDRHHRASDGRGQALCLLRQGRLLEPDRRLGAG